MEFIIATLVLATSILVGYILKEKTKEEINIGKKYFKLLWTSSIMIILIIPFLPFDGIIKQTAIFSLLYIMVISYISWK
jgi:hypothetical protein